MPSESLYDLTEQANRRNLGHRHLLRALAFVALAAMCVFVPAVGGNRFVVAVLLVALAPASLALARATPVNAVVGQSFVDVLAIGAVAFLLPEAWAACAVLVTAVPAASAALIGRTNYGLVASLGLLLVVTAATFNDVAGWLVPSIVAVILIPLVSSYVGVFVADERTARTQLTDVIASEAVLFWEFDLEDRRMLAINGRYERILGYARGELPLAELDRLFHPSDGRWIEDAAELRPGEQITGEVRLRHATGSWVTIRCHARVVHDRGRRILRGVGFDISPLVEAHEETRRRAEVDELTGLPNRSVLLRELDKRLRRNEPVGLLLLDLDRFKDVNDTLGHQAGDVFLQVISRRLEAAVRNSADALVARLGGDEFAVVTCAGAGCESVVDLADELADACSQPVLLDGLEVAAGASIGVALAPEHGRRRSDLFRRADLAMYAAKPEERSVHVFVPATDEPTIDRLELTGQVESAIENGEFRLWFQPKVDLGTGQVVAVEGLLRWHHPVRGVLVPADFLDVVELSRHYRSLTHEVLVQGVQFAADAIEAGCPLQVAVNVSASNLLEPDFVDRVGSLLADRKVPPASLMLEVTEREIVDEGSLGMLRLAPLRQLGVGLAIDDFGTGHSSLVRIQRLPVDEIKIDRAFIAALGDDDSSEIIVRSVVALGRNLGLTVVAEGVERPSDVDLLLDTGCHLAQGFLFSQAVEAQALLGQLTAESQRRVAQVG